MSLPFKVCFHMSYTPDIGRHTKKYHGKMHFCGRTLEEAVSKVRLYVARFTIRERGICTSMWLMREKDPKPNVKWAEYHASGEAKKLWDAAVAEAKKEIQEFREAVERGRE